MDIILKKVVELQFLKSNIDKNIDFYLNEEKNELLLDGKFVTIDEICEPIMENAKISLSEDEFIQYLSREKWKQNYDIGRLLYKKLVKFNDISGDILDESFWVYITHIPYVKKYIIKRYFNTINDDEDQNLKLIDKIKRYFFGDGIISRTGVIFNWKLTNCLYYKDIGNKSDELCYVAFSYIDSVKAMFERSFRKNPIIIKAFVEGIIRNNKSQAFTNSKYKTLIPTHISNVAALNCFDAYSYKDLVDKITYEQKVLIDEYNKSKN
ncbi:MAG: DUF6339 family protein [Bacilli bacterium]|nr:DUF6339 family protein [Bacilli bacterium]